MIDFHDKLATQQQDQAKQGLGDHLVPFPESEVPHGCGQTPPITGASDSEESE